MGRSELLRPWDRYRHPAFGRSLQLRQRTAYPLDGRVVLELRPAREQRFPLYLRIPGWSQRTGVSVNGEPVADVRPGSYLRLERVWRAGDRIELALDMSPHFWFGEREAAGKLSVYRGPLLLAYDPRYDVYDPPGIPALSPGSLAFEPEDWDGSSPPWLLVRVPTADGRTMRLCDFASAGGSGTEYRSWLPVDGQYAAEGGVECVWKQRVEERV